MSDPDTATPPSLADVEAARERIAPYLPRTPLVGTRTLGQMTNTTLSLKAANPQRTGAVQVRGGLNAAVQPAPEQRQRGVVTFSAGNHGQALAYAASLVGVRCVAFMPATAVPTKVEAIRGYGAETRFAPEMGQVFPMMEAYRK